MKRTRLSLCAPLLAASLLAGCASAPPSGGNEVATVAIPTPFNRVRRDAFKFFLFGVLIVSSTLEET